MSLIIKTQANGIHQHETKALTKIRQAFSVEDEMRKVNRTGFVGDCFI